MAGRAGLFCSGWPARFPKKSQQLAVVSADLAADAENSFTTRKA
jgi:hypothetical protein